MIKKIIILLVVVCLGIFLYFKFNEKQDINNLTLYGNIEIRQVDLSFQVSGLVSKLLKEEGDTEKYMVNTTQQWSHRFSVIHL